MRVVFMGYLGWGLATLESVVESDHEVVFVATHPDPTTEYEKSFNDSIQCYANERGIPTVQRKSADERMERQIRDLAPDVVVSSNWRSYIPTSIRNSARFGAINVHRSLLPRYGGVAPINWAIANGEEETGVTVHVVEDEFDLGDILGQEPIPIGPDDTATEIFHRTRPVIGRLVPRVLQQLSDGAPERLIQDSTQATFFHKRLEPDLLIDWRRPREDVYNLIRAQSDPFANAFTYHQGRKLRIKRASLPERKYCGTPGRVFLRTPARDGVVILCGGSVNHGQGIVIHTVQPDGGNAINANDYFDSMGQYVGGWSL